jgi:hypothetical protein
VLRHEGQRGLGGQQRCDSGFWSGSWRGEGSAVVRRLELVPGQGPRAHVEPILLCLDLVTPTAMGAAGCRSGKGTPSGASPVSGVLAAEYFPVSSLVLRCSELGRRGGGPRRWESCWLAGKPMTLVLDGDHGREDGVVVGELSVVGCRWR